MLANNEVGTIQPIADIAERVRKHRGVLFAVDAVQAAPHLELDVAALGVDLLAISAHKFEGPKGVGALYLRHGTHILSQQQGGSQERHRRGGTENVAGAIGMATAFDLAAAERPETVKRLRRLRERLQKSALAVDGVELTGHPKERLPGHLSLIARTRTAARSPSRWISTGSPRRSARPARPARPRSRTSSRRWATPRRRRAARCA